MLGYSGAKTIKHCSRGRKTWYQRLVQETAKCEDQANHIFWVLVFLICKRDHALLTGHYQSMHCTHCLAQVKTLSKVLMPLHRTNLSWSKPIDLASSGMNGKSELQNHNLLNTRMLKLILLGVMSHTRISELCFKSSFWNIVSWPNFLLCLKYFIQYLDFPKWASTICGFKANFINVLILIYMRINLLNLNEDAHILLILMQHLFRCSKTSPVIHSNDRRGLGRGENSMWRMGAPNSL